MNTKRMRQINKLVTIWNAETAKSSKPLSTSQSMFKHLVEDALLDRGKASIGDMKHWIRGRKKSRLKEEKLNKLPLMVEVINNKIKILPR